MPLGSPKAFYYRYAKEEIMKNKFVKYLLLFILAVIPCVTLSACKEVSGGLEEFISILNESKSESLNLSEENSEVEGGESSSQDSKEEGSSESESVEPENSYEEDEDEEKPTGCITHSMVVSSVDAGCTTDGYYKKWCENCDFVEKFYTIDAVGHFETEATEVSPTCQSEGYSSYMYCMNCGKIMEEGHILPKIDHDYVKGFGACVWCEVVELSYEVVEGDRCYAVCVGPVERIPKPLARYVYIPETVTTIAKDSNGLDKVYENIPVVKIAPKAFLKAYDLNKLVIGENVEEIGESAFIHCYNLREVYDKSQIKVGLQAREDNGCITDHVNQEDIHYTDDYTSKISEDKATGCFIYTDGDKVELIGIRDIVEDLVIPEGVTHMSNAIFVMAYEITTLTIAKTVKYIAPLAFGIPCDQHRAPNHEKKDCSFILEKISFLNPYGWGAYLEIGGELLHNFTAMELSDNPEGICLSLALEYTYAHWIRTDN